MIDLCMRTNVNERPSAMEIVTSLQVRMLALPAYSCITPKQPLCSPWRRWLLLS